MYTPSWAAEHGEGSPLLGDPTMSREAAHLHLRVSAGHDASALLSTITAPTLVLHGDADLMSPVKNAFRLTEAIPDSRCIVIQNGRHGFFEEFSSSVTPQLLRFLG